MLGPDTVSFLTDLAANNNRDWFKGNEARYKQDFKLAADVFGQGLAAELGEATNTDLTYKVFRIHRDVRFSKDKTPYNTHLRVFAAVPGAAPDYPKWMAGLEQDRLVVGVGSFGFAKETLVRYRDMIDGAGGDELAEILSAQMAGGVRLGAPDLKRVPKPYDADHRHGDLLRCKGLTAWIDHKDHAIALGDNGPQQVAASLLNLRPIYNWLAALTA